MIPGKVFKKKGKVYSKVNMGQRRESDEYSTPYSLTNLFLDKWPIPIETGILEPAAGSGAISKVLMDRGYKNITSGDIKSGYDFLKEDRVFNCVITNPPYSLAHEFIKKCMAACYKFALLLPITYISGQKRFLEIFRLHQYPFVGTFTFTRMPMLGDPLRPDGKFRTGMTVYSWFVWDHVYDGKPQHVWLDNNQYVLGKGDKYCKDCRFCGKLVPRQKYIESVVCRKGREGRISISVCEDFREKDKYAGFDDIID